MTLVEFHEKLYKIDFKEGTNIQRLEHYLLACLAQLNLYKYKPPSYEIFLLIFEQARNGEKVDFPWTEVQDKEQETKEDESENLKEWKSVRDGLRPLITDLIQTREIRSQPGNTYKENPFDWDTEGGIRFYNGTSPNSILKYAASRFEGEYSAPAYEEGAVTWQEFTHPIWIGISYE